MVTYVDDVDVGDLVKIAATSSSGSTMECVAKVIRTYWDESEKISIIKIICATIDFQNIDYEIDPRDTRSDITISKL